MKTKLLTLAMLLFSAASFAQTSADESAIKTVVELESMFFRQCKADKAISYWLNAPYISHDYTEKGKGYLRGYTAVTNAMRAYIKAHPEMAADKAIYKNHDYQIHVNGNSAWATYITDVVNGTKKSQSYNGRYLEKVNGLWKIGAVAGKPAP